MRKAHVEPRVLTSFVLRAAGALLLWSCATAYAGGPTKDQPPTVTLTSPTSMDSFIAPGTIPLAATASDPDGAIVRVDFFQGNTLIGSSTTAPYTASWSNVPVGTYSITAKATDNSGSTATSAPVSVTVNSATSLVITSPADGSSCQLIYTCGSSVSGTFESSFATGNTILVDSEGVSALATISGNSYSAFAWGPTAPGPTTITVRLARPDRTFVTRSITISAYAAPVIVFTAPSTSTFLEPANTTFVADAKAPGGTVTKVSFYYHNSLDFFRDSILFGTVTSPPYQIALPNLAKGTYTISAVATNDHGVGGSTIRTITVVGPNVPPSISITSPASGAVFNAPASVPVSVNATDSDGTVTLVEFFGDGALLGASNSAPFSFTWSNVALGAHTITARATDNQGAQTTSAPVSITVNNPPTAALTSPMPGATFSTPSTVTLTANAADSDGTVVRVEFYQGSTLIGTSTTAPYAVGWSVIVPGTYTLTARAIDNQGAVGISAPVTVTVSSGGTITFLHNDFAGNPIAATDANGNLLWKENFRPYGDRLNNQAAASGNRQWFHGKPADADTGLSYFGARYYDPTLGRFMGIDSVHFAEDNIHSFNGYAYGNNNPYKFVDPDGRLVFLIPMAAGALIGGGINLSVQLYLANGDISRVNLGQVAVAAVAGALGGGAGVVAATATTTGGAIAANAIAGAAIGAGAVHANGAIDGRSVSTADVVKGAALAAGLSGAAGAVAALPSAAGKASVASMTQTEKTATENLIRGVANTTRSAGGSPNFAPAGQGLANGAAATISNADNLLAQPGRNELK